MPFTATLLTGQGGDQKVWNCSFAAADTGTGVITHDFPFTPDFATITPFGGSGAGVYAERLSITSITATSITITKLSDAACTFRVRAGRPYHPRSGR
jgi:hypothetical protein